MCAVRTPSPVDSYARSMSAGSMSLRRVATASLAAALTLAACGTTSGPAESDGNAVAESDAATDAPADVATVARYTYPPAPPAPPADQPNAAADDAVDRIVFGINGGALDPSAVDDLAGSGDARYGWFVSDLLRFFGGQDATRLIDTFETLTGASVADDPDLTLSPWLSVTNHLIAWDTPDYGGYQDDKGGIFTQLEPGWTPFFDDHDAAIDWRHLSWGGVFIDDRPLGDPDGCPGGCIPALDDPPTTDAAGGSWYPDERTVFGIVIGDVELSASVTLAREPP